MKQLKNIILLAYCLVFTTAMPVLSQSTLVKIEPPNMSADVDEIFTVNVDIEGANNLRGISVKVAFDPAILEAKGVSSGGFMSAFGQTFSFSDKNNDEGWVQYDESILGSVDMAHGNGTVCKIEFKAISNGSSALTFALADLRDYDNMPVEATTEDGMVIVGGAAVVVKIKAALEGAYDQEKASMRTRLKEQDMIPLSSPYSSAPEVISAIPNNVVDWVLVGLRRSSSGADVAEKSCFLKADGTVTQSDEQPNLTFWSVEDGSYYIVLSHRNHLSVMSANPVSLSGTAVTYDFTVSTSQYYGGQAKLLTTNPDGYGLFAGDGDGNGQINQADLDGVLTNRDDVGYAIFDFNLSGIVTISDLDGANSNSGLSTNVPTN